MDNLVSKLKEIIDNYPDVLQDDKKLKSILKDYFPEDKRTQNQLYMVVDEGIVDDMKGCSEVKKFKMLGYIHGLAGDYGIPETMAQKAIMVWIRALGIQADEVEVSDSNTNSNSTSGTGMTPGVVDLSDRTFSDTDVKGEIIRISGNGAKIIPHVKLSDRFYLVKLKADSSFAADFYDKDRNSQTIIVARGSEEKMWQLYDDIDISEDGIIEVKLVRDNWELELVPM